MFETAGVPDCGMVAKEILVLAIGVRGNVRTTIEVTTPNVPIILLSITVIVGGKEHTSTSAPEGPEQIRIRLCIRNHKPSVCSYCANLQHMVCCQTIEACIRTMACTLKVSARDRNLRTSSIQNRRVVSPRCST